MKRLYVGCRVRITGCDAGSLAKNFIGMEARIVKKTQNLMGWDMWGVDIGDGGWCFLDHELEPIQDPGHQVGTWEGCVWQPEWFKAWSA